MSSVTTTVLEAPSAAPFHTTAFTQTCHKCGADLSHSHPGISEDAQRRISELETQVKILTGKATAAGMCDILLRPALRPAHLVPLLTAVAKAFNIQLSSLRLNADPFPS